CAETILGGVGEAFHIDLMSFFLGFGSVFLVEKLSVGGDVFGSGGGFFVGEASAFEVALIDGCAGGDGFGFLKLTLLFGVFDEGAEPAVFFLRGALIAALIHRALSTDVLDKACEVSVGRIELFGGFAASECLIPGAYSVEDVHCLFPTRLRDFFLF